MASLHAREQLLQRRVLPIETYADELRRGVYSTLSIHDRRRRFGSSVLPIHVPLDPGETEAQHERRFVIWLSRRNLTLDDLHGNANDQRDFRIRFARIKTKMYVQRYGLTKRRRDEYEEEEEEEDDDDEEGEDDENDSDDDEGSATRQYVSEKASLWLRTRVLTADAYRAEVERDSVQKPTPHERRKRFGTTIEPIPIPLSAGETPAQYERSFLSILASRGLTLAKLAHNPSKERSIRMNYARSRVGGHFKVSQIATLAKKAKATTSTVTKPTIVQDSESPEATTRSQAADSQGGFPMVCTLLNDAETPKAYLTCGCRKCLLRCTDGLVHQVTQLQQDVGASASAHDTHRHGSHARHRGADSFPSSSVTAVTIAVHEH